MEHNGLNHELVSKEAAITLKEMGHDAWCDCYYHADNDDPWDYEMGHNQQCNSSLLGERVAAPYVTDAVLWLMQHKGIALYVNVAPSADSETGFLYVVSLGYGSGNEIMATNVDYQKALVTAIDRLLEDDRFTLSPNTSFQPV